MFGINDFGKAIVDFSNFEISQLVDALVFGGAILILGMLTIFSVLSILWLCLVLFKVAFHDLPQKKKAVATEIVAPAQEIAEEAPSSSGDEIIAAIAAAIAMAESESSGLKFRVVSFKRK